MRMLFVEKYNSLIILLFSAVCDKVKDTMAYYEIDEKLRENELFVTITEFKVSYNSTIPERFPHASTPLLKQFKNAHPSLFKGKSTEEAWSVVKHRKKVMDWLSTQDKPEVSK